MSPPLFCARVVVMLRPVTVAESCGKQGAPTAETRVKAGRVRCAKYPAFCASSTPKTRLGLEGFEPPTKRL